jgi:hypothetical protein
VEEKRDCLDRPYPVEVLSKKVEHLWMDLCLKAWPIAGDIQERRGIPRGLPLLKQPFSRSVVHDICSIAEG